MKPPRMAPGTGLPCCISLLQYAEFTAFPMLAALCCEKGRS